MNRYERSRRHENGGQITIQKPQLLKFSGEDQLSHFIHETNPARIIDNYDIWLQELHTVNHPQETKESRDDFIQQNNVPENGTWVYYQDTKEIIHILDHPQYHQLLTSRNYPIISHEEQRMLQECTVGIAGLSVGRSAAMLMAMIGVERFRIADSDTVGPSNLNRLIGSDIFEVGENKAEALAKKTWRLNPYATIDTYTEGLTEANIDEFLLGKDEPLSMAIDAIDALKMKAEMRKRTKIPILMATDLGWDPLLEIESPTTPSFHGNVTEEDMKQILSGNLSFQEKSRLAAAIIGINNIPPIVMHALDLARRGEINYWSQIGPAAFIAAAMLTKSVLEVLKNPNLDMQNTIFNLSSRFQTAPEYNI